MKKLTEIDLLVRKQLINCCFAEKVIELACKLEIGTYCESDIDKVNMMMASLEVLKCYEVSDTRTILEEDDFNTISYGQMIDIINMFVEECNLCFEPAGTEYQDCNE